MKIKLIIIFLCLSSIRLTLFSQEIKELKVNEIVNGKEFWDLYRSIEFLKKTDTLAFMLKLENVFSKTKNSFTKCKILEELGPLYVSTKQYDKCLKMCEALIDSGMSVFFKYWGETYPEYTKSFQNNDKFISLLNRNNKLVDEVNKNSKVEYYIQKPENYNEKIRFPLLIVFHGGIGNIQDMQNYWTSTILSKDYLVAFVHGKDYKCSYTYSYGKNVISDLKKTYKKITEEYLIDTTKVILSGPSAGGMFSIELAINEHINAQGLILAFPVKPDNFSADKIYNAGIKGFKISMICGENDWAIQSQKEMSVIFDKLGLKNKLIIFPDLGHDFPKEFSTYIDNSINYIRGID